MTLPTVDPRLAGRVYTHITLDGEGERIFDYELALLVGDVLVLHRTEGDKHFAVAEVRNVVMDSPRPVGDVALYSTFVVFVRCEEIPEPMTVEESPLSPPPDKVRNTKERP